MDELLDLLEYHQWASERTLEAASALSAEQYTKDLGSSFPSVRDTLVHIFSADRAWHGRIQGQAPARANPADYPDVAVLKAAWLGVLTSWPEVVKRLGDAKQAISYKAFDGTAYSSMLGEIVRHVVNHATYHHGQVTTMLRQFGAKPIGTDLITFYRAHTK